MNRDKALFIADRIMTRIETDKAIHKDAIADEIQAAEVIDVISYDEAKGQWVHRDGTPLDMGDDRVNSAFADALAHALGVQRIRLEDFKA